MRKYIVLCLMSIAVINFYACHTSNTLKEEVYPVSQESDYVTITNKRDKPIVIEWEVSSRMGREGNLIYKKKVIGRLNIGVTKKGRKELRAGGSISCFWFYGSNGWEPAGEFRQQRMRAIGQLKVVYKKLSIKDEQGNELLNLEDIRPEHIRRGYFQKYWYDVEIR